MNELAGLNIAILTTGHPAVDARIYYKEILTLNKFGADITYLFPDCGKVPENIPEGVRLVPFAAKTNLKYRLLHYDNALKTLSAEKFDVIHCHEPDALYLAKKIKKNRPKVKIIYDSHEMWGAVFAERQPSFLWPIAEPFYNFFESRLLHYCDGAIGAAPAITDYLCRYLPAEKVETILNVPSADVFPVLQPAAITDGQVILIHEGHLTFDRGLKTIAEAIKILSADYPVILKIIGDTYGEANDWLEEYRLAHNLEKNIIKTGWLPYEKVGEVMATGHIGINGHYFNPNNAICAPNKCFNYLFYGLAQVAANLPKSQYKIFSDENCALLFQPGSSSDMAKQLKKYLDDRDLLSQHRKNALNLSLKKYRWEHMEQKLFDLYCRIMEK